MYKKIISTDHLAIIEQLKVEFDSYTIDSENGRCTEWIGPPKFKIGNHYLVPAVAYLFLNDKANTLCTSTISIDCGNSKCVNPAHISTKKRKSLNSKPMFFPRNIVPVLDDGTTSTASKRSITIKQLQFYGVTYAQYSASIEAISRRRSRRISLEALSKIKL